jgi:archaellum component FlaC
MGKMLDAEDIIIQKLKNEVEKLEKELTVLRGRYEFVVDNLDVYKNKVKQLSDRATQFSKIERDFIILKKVVEQIAKGEVEDPVSYAKKKIIDL